MIKNQKRITNPITVIAIFATLSETSAAVSLPFLDHKEREIYIWFLMIFPFYLLLLFFATLNFNYRSLYAPSDFAKGKDFVKILDSVTKREGAIKDRRPTSPSSAQAPPTEVDVQNSRTVKHHIRLHESLEDLYIIDARWFSKKMEFSTLWEKTQELQNRQAHVLLFLTDAESERLLKECALKYSKQAKKRGSATFCVVYNLSSRGMTVIDQCN
ncbi:hypothetical protein [Pseudomonas sp. NFX224]|uniref:hypothetical protein n=1 Tax=Pseudomonas sp. NFX224 TaxID=3402862 RepID=UPI003AFA0BCE